MKQIYKLCLAGAIGSCLAVSSMEANSVHSHFGTLQPTVTTRLGNTTHTVTNQKVEMHRKIGNVSQPGIARSFGRTESLKFNSGWKAPAQNITINLSFPAEDDGIFVQAAGFTAEDGEQYWAMQEEAGGPIFVELPAGKYVVTGFFAVCDPEPDEWGQYSQKSSAMVVKENVEFNANSEYSIDGSEATNFITASPVGPTGEGYDLTVYMVVPDEDGDPIEGDMIPGTANYISQRMGLYHKTLGELFWSQIGLGARWVSEYFSDINDPELAEVGGVYVNDFSDDIIVMGSFEIHPVQGVPGLTVAMQEGSAAAVLKANPKDYTYVQTKYEQSEMGKAQPFPPVEDPWSIEMTNYFGSKTTEGMSVESSADLSLFNYCATPASAVDFANGATVVYKDYTSAFESDTIYDDEWMYVSSWRVTSSSTCPEVYIKNGEKTILNRAEPTFYNMPSAPKDPTALVPSQFKYTNSQQLQPYGRTPGFVNSVVASAVDGTKAELMLFTPQYCGYAGDYVAAVMSTIDTDPVITYNGNPVDYDTEYYSDFWSGGFWGWCWDWNYEGHPAGAYTMDFEGPMNIDGVEGKVQYSVAFDQTKSDCVPPVVQYLQFRDKEGNVTCKFDEALQGDLYICAGDFKADSEGVISAYVEGAVPTVSYAPYGTEDWVAMDLDKIADAADCFAPIYKGSLLQIGGESSNGWFDLKIEMTDAAGNSMSQMSSPAFCISSLGGSGISPVNNDALALNIDGRNVTAAGNCIEVYTLYGVKVASISANHADLSNLPAGVYIVRSGNATVKTILK